MPALMERPSVAKRNDETVRVDADILRKARIVAAIKGLSLAEYLSEVLRPAVDREHAELVTEEAKGVKPKPPKR